MSRSRRSDWIDWRKAEAREIILEDLATGTLPIDNDVVSAEEAWNEMYCAMPEFEHVVFSQFEARLKDHRMQVARLQNASTHFLDSFRHDQELRSRGILRPQGTHDRAGRRIFDRSAAKPLLKEDVIDEKHLQLTAEELHSSRQEYREWPLPIFKKRLRQAIHTQKFLYYLNWKRAKKQQKRGLRSEDPGVDSEEEGSDN
jgi:hypothetical protein